MTSKGSPIAGSERAIALDALRGVALFGVLLVNVLTIFRVSLFAQFLVRTARRSGADYVVSRMSAMGLEFKAFTLFSLLFGIGLAAQHERTRQRGVAFGRYAARRLGFLLVLGLAHLFLVWNGDVLTLYALLGIIAAPLLRLSTRALFALALALFVAHLCPLPFPTPFASYRALHDHVIESYDAYGRGTFGEALAFRIREVRPVAALLFWTTPRVLGLFLLGACAWRAGVFRGEQRTLVRFVAGVGLVSGGALTWLASSDGVDLGTWRDVASRAASLVLALGYGAAIVAVFDEPRLPHAKAVLRLFAPLGQMALTSYLTQSIVLSALFYGWGLGLFGRLGEAEAAAIGVAIFVVQVAFSTAWLRRYRFGPVEWLWRSFTYGARQPMRR
ncbi:MAG: uncharacterized protein QOI41_7744 [Myxococcales bacterium]|nr:uncharacterized protein [Myxococcales bacterium]